MKGSYIRSLGTRQNPKRNSSAEQLSRLITNKDMKKLLLISIVFLGMRTVTAGQDIRIKGMFFPLAEHSVGLEILLNKHFSGQLLYQNQIQLHEGHSHLHHRLIPSIRYYLLSDNKVLNHLYIETFYRQSFIRLRSDTRVFKYATSSFGLSAGRQFILSDKFLIDLSFGHYYIYSNNENEWQDFPNNIIFPYQYRHRWRIDIKFGFILTNKKTTSR
jgi:hypothetical protein